MTASSLLHASTIPRRRRGPKSALRALATAALGSSLIGVSLLRAAQAEPAAGSSTAPSLEAALEQAVQQSPQLLEQLLLAAVMVLACTLIHLAVTLAVVKGYEHPQLLRWASRSSRHRISLIALTGLITFLAMVIEILAWALLYLSQGAISDLEQSLYFSSVTFASLGYGDITLPTPFRLLASLEALVGILMAGWSTALLVAVAQKCLSLREQHTSQQRASANGDGQGNREPPSSRATGQSPGPHG